METIKCEKCGKTVVEYQRWYHSYLDVCRGHSKRISDMEEIYLSELSDDDCFLLTDTSEHKSVRVKLGTLKAFFKL